MIHTAVLVLKFLINLRFKQLGDIPNFNHYIIVIKSVIHLYIIVIQSVMHHYVIVM